MSVTITIAGDEDDGRFPVYLSLPCTCITSLSTLHLIREPRSVLLLSWKHYQVSLTPYYHTSHYIISQHMTHNSIFRVFLENQSVSSFQHTIRLSHKCVLEIGIHATANLRSQVKSEYKENEMSELTSVSRTDWTGLQPVSICHPHLARKLCTWSS